MYLIADLPGKAEKVKLALSLECVWRGQLVARLLVSPPVLGLAVPAAVAGNLALGTPL